jgi:aspartate aminotransferase-like enzyme
MVISMTNRLLAVVIALALSSGIVAHAAQAPQKPLTPNSLSSSSDLSTLLQTAASHITESATGAIDPAAAIRDAYQRDHVALEALRQQASALQGSAHPAFNQYIDSQEAALTELLHTSLATLRPAAGSTITSMDALVSAAQLKLGQELAASSKAAGQSNGSAGSKSRGNSQQPSKD